MTRGARGKEAEEAAAAWLEGRGYRVLACNHRTPAGEVDLVCADGETLCFVEVRMRTSAVFGDPSQTVTFAKQRRVVKAALHYLFAGRIRDRALRFDVITVLGRGDQAVVEHLENAFDAGM